MYKRQRGNGSERKKSVYDRKGDERECRAQKMYSIAYIRNFYRSTHTYVYLCLLMWILDAGLLGLYVQIFVVRGFRESSCGECGFRVKLELLVPPVVVQAALEGVDGGGIDH